MNRFQSLRTAIVLLVMAIMSISCFISGAFLLVFKVAGAIQWTPLFLTIAMLEVSLVVGTVLAFFVSKRFLKPVRELIEANKRVAQGDFSVRVREDDENTGEMQELLNSFNRMVNELQGIELYRTDFINNFSHEFKTPIVSVRGFAKQLKNPDLSDEQRQEYLDIIIKESEKLCNMSGNVLQISKLENQNLVADRTVFSLDEQLRNAILLLERSWDEKQIAWELDLPSTEFYGNPDLISQIWKNLLENAIKFTPEKGTICVVLREENHRVTVQIADNGCGMDEQTKSHIFEKFYQGDTSHAKQGNGLGLAIVKRIVDLCEGTISAESAVNQGACFTVCLPNLKKNQ